MSLILNDVVIIPVIIERAVGDNMSLLSVQPTLSLRTDRLVMTWDCPVAVRTTVVRTVLSDVVP